MTHLPVSSCGMEREPSATFRRQPGGVREGGSSPKLGLLFCFKNSEFWNCHFFGLKWPLVLWNQISPGTSSFLITRLEVVAGTKEASAQSQGDLHGALSKLDQWGLSLLPIHLAEQDAGRQPWKRGIFLFFSLANKIIFIVTHPTLPYFKSNAHHCRKKWGKLTSKRRF